MSKRSVKALKVVVLTGSTGRTGSQVVNSALAQFEAVPVELVVCSDVHTVSAVRKTIRNAKADGSLIVQTLVKPMLRQAAAEECERLGVLSFDPLGPVIRMLSDRLGREPRNIPGLSYELNKEQFDRMDAVDFTMRHDDGQRAEDLAEADVVLVGASRVSKSVTCFYLASRGLRAANVPLSLTFAPPQILQDLDPRKVIALTMNPRRLQMIREIRAEPWAGAQDYYADRRIVIREVKHVEAIAKRRHWHCIDVSYKAVEEVCDDIVNLIASSSKT
jgi:regulator of PEP synthase PpsR (kinase-PPPase family)